MSLNLTSRRTLTRAFATTAAGLGILALAACGQTSHSSTSSGTDTKPAAQTQGKQAGGANDSHVRNPGSSGIRECQTGDLKVSTFRYDSGKDFTLARLNFKNISGTTCTMYGFPGVSYMSAEDGHQVGKAAARKANGAYGAATLKPGGWAYSFVNMPEALSLSNAECQPTHEAGLRIFPPDNTDATFLDVSGYTCATGADRMTVYPVNTDPNAIPSN